MTPTGSKTRFRKTREPKAGPIRRIVGNTPLKTFTEAVDEALAGYERELFLADVLEDYGVQVIALEDDVANVVAATQVVLTVTDAEWRLIMKCLAAFVGLKVTSKPEDRERAATLNQQLLKQRVNILEQQLGQAKATLARAVEAECDCGEAKDEGNGQTSHASHCAALKGHA